MASVASQLFRAQVEPVGDSGATPAPETARRTIASQLFGVSSSPGIDRPDFADDPLPGSAQREEIGITQPPAPGTFEAPESVPERLAKALDSAGLTPVSLKEAENRFGGVPKAVLDNLGINIARFVPELVAGFADDPAEFVRGLPGFFGQAIQDVTTDITGKQFQVFGQDPTLENFDVQGLRLTNAPPERVKEVRERITEQPLAPILAGLGARGLATRGAVRGRQVVDAAKKGGDILQQRAAEAAKIPQEPIKVNGVDHTPARVSREIKPQDVAVEAPKAKIEPKAIKPATTLRPVSDKPATSLRPPRAKVAPEPVKAVKEVKKPTELGKTLARLEEVDKPFAPLIGKRITRSDFNPKTKRMEPQVFEMVKPNQGNPIFSKVVNGKVQKKGFVLGEFGRKWLKDEAAKLPKPKTAVPIKEPVVAPKKVKAAKPSTKVEVPELTTTKPLELPKPDIKVEVPKGGKSSLLQGIESAEKSAQARIAKRHKDRGTELRSGLRPEDFADVGDVVVIGAAKVARGTVKFAEWSKEMVTEFGDNIKPHLKKIWADAQDVASGKRDASLAQLKNFHESISKPFKGEGSVQESIIQKTREKMKTLGKDPNMTPKQKRVRREELKSFITQVQAEKAGIATRTTKGGKKVLSQRKAGPFVPADFTAYENFKDIKGRLSKNPTIGIQEIDGSLTLAEKVKLPDQVGPVEKYVLHRTRDVIKLRNSFNNEQSVKLQTITKDLSKSERVEATQVLREVNASDAKAKTSTLMKKPSISKITKSEAVVKAAQEARKYFDEILKAQNEFRAARGQKPIPRRDLYTPDILNRIKIWEETFGWDKTARDIMEQPELPDFINPNKPFNPHERAKQGNIPDVELELDLAKLMESYANTASRDIFHTEIIQNNKAFTQQLRDMNFNNSAKFIEDWTSEAFAGVKGGIDRSFQVGKTASKIMTFYRSALNRSVFPLNFAWNVTVQTSSSALTVARYGVKNSVQGAYEWFGNGKLRKDIESKAYSAVVKSAKDASITKQDVSAGGSGRIVAKRTKMDSAVDAANFFTEWTERHLTGWSVATAKIEGAKAGLKGKALWEYASDGGAKTQSMYNLEDAPAILRNEVVKTAAPFNTFSFELYNSMKEFAGKTGTPPATFKNRMGQALRFTAGVVAINTIWGSTVGKEPWDMRGFVPFYKSILAPVVEGTEGGKTSVRGLPSPVGVGAQFTDGVKRLIEKGQWDKLRSWVLKYLTASVGIPAGTQLNRTVDGLIAISKGGDFDAAGRMKYPITEVDDQLLAITAGKYATEGGQEYLDKRTNRKDLLEQILKPDASLLFLPFEDGKENQKPFQLKTRSRRPQRTRPKRQRRKR